MTLARLNGYERRIARCVPILAVLFTMLSSATLLAAQNPEYDFYPELRNSYPEIYAPEPFAADDAGTLQTAVTLRSATILPDFR